VRELIDWGAFGRPLAVSVVTAGSRFQADHRVHFGGCRQLGRRGGESRGGRVRLSDRLRPARRTLSSPRPGRVARATRTIGFGPFALNTGLWNPATVTRELTTLDQLSGGRLEITVGSGLPRLSLQGIIPPSPQARFERLQATVNSLCPMDEMRRAALLRRQRRAVNS
jgi:hypothetical protein